MTGQEQKQTMISHANFFGLYNRKNQAIEEMAELTQALCKHSRLLCDQTFDGTREQVNTNLYEELADVEILLFELKHCLMVDEKLLNKVKQVKLERTDKKIMKKLRGEKDGKTDNHL